MADDNLIELAGKRTPRPGTWGRRGPAGKRYVRTPEGAEKYGLPIGALITADAIRRAQARGRSYSVPEDSGDFGSKPPAAGRTRKDASELVSAIRSAPAPRRTNPEGPKKVAVGNAGFGFPEGSRTFRPKDHENFAIVRTPDYQLVVVTDKGIAFELDGDLERELNEELDDDASLNFNVDEPREVGGDVDGDGRTWESSAADGATPDAQRPSRVEDMPGFLAEDRIQEIMDGMEQAGLDQQSRDAAELQLHRSNNRIRAEFEAGQRDETDETTPPETPDEPDAVNQLVDEIDREARDAVDRGFAEPDGQSSPDQDSTSESGSPRREEATEDQSAQRQPSRRGRSTESSANRRQRLAPEQEERPSQPIQGGSGDAEQDPDEQLRALEDLAQGRSSGVAEGAVGGADVSVRRNRVNGEMEYFSGNESLDSRDDVLTRARTTERPQRDTSDLAVGDLTDDELTALREDLNNFLATRDFPPRRVLRRSRDVEAEIARRQGDEEQDRQTEEPTPEAPAAPENVPSGSPGDGTYEDLSEPEDILDARPGDAFVARHVASGVDHTFVVGEDGRVYPNTGGFGIDREGFRDWLASDDYELWASKSNRDNQASRPSAESGDAATSTWAREAEAGAVAYSPDGVVAEKNEDGSWETPMGRVNDQFFDVGDVEGDAPEVIVRTEPDVDGRPVGATTELDTPEDLEDVRTRDNITFVSTDGRQANATRRDDDTLIVELGDGLTAEVPFDEVLLESETFAPWHVPNQDHVGEPSQESWSAGDRVRSMDDLNALTPGTVVRAQISTSSGDAEEYNYVIELDGRMRRATWPEGTTVGNSVLRSAISRNEVKVVSVPDTEPTRQELEDRREALVPRVVENLEDYQIGDTISDYRHIRDMKAGDQVTMAIPASRNGGREMHVVLTRTGDENTLGGYMFLVGNGGRGYNSFGENNQNLYQAIADGRLLFGDVTSLDGTDRQRIEGDWSTAKNIELWEGGPKVSEADLRQYIASQMSSMAMQKSYFDPELLPESNPFQSQDLRRAFAKKAKEKYDTPGNPMRSKPASIRYASELLGVEFNDPGSALVADDLTPEDFRKKVTIGRWLRRTEAPAEPNMGPEQVEVTVADIKTALAIIDNMLESDDPEEPDKILKRVFAQHGSPLQNMNTSAAVAAYFGVERYRMREDGTWKRMTTIGKQYDKKRNKELFRQMLLEQLEGREPGYYGIPEDERFERDEKQYLNRSKLSRPEINSENDGTQPPAPTPEPESPASNAPLTIQDILNLNDGDRITGTLGGVDYDFDVDGATYVDTQYGTLYRRTEPALASMEWAGWTFRRAESSPATDVSGITPNSAETLEDLNRAFQNGEISLREFRTRERAANLNSVSEPVSSAEDAPSRDFPMEEARRAELDRMEWDDAWRSAQANNDALNYIEDVMGPDGVSALNDGSLSMRAQFVRAHEQANPETPEADAPERLTDEDLGQLTGGERVVAIAPDGSEFIMQRSGARLVTNDGRQVDLSDLSRIHGISRYRDRGWTFRRATDDEVAADTPSGAPEASAPETSPDTGELTTDASVIENLPEGTRVTFTSSDGTTHETTATTNRYGNPVLQIEGGGGLHRSESSINALLESGSTFRVHDSGNEGPTPGATFRGADIRNIPVGSLVQSRTGAQLRVTESGLQAIQDPAREYSFDRLSITDTEVTYVSATAPEVRTFAPGTMVSAAQIREMPNGSRFRRGNGAQVWTRQGSNLISENGTRFSIGRIQNATYLGDQEIPAIRTRTAREEVQTLESAGLTRVSDEVITSYDRPRDMPTGLGFDPNNTEPLREYLDTAEGREDLRNAFRAILPENTEIYGLSSSSGGFSVSYRTPEGKTGQLSRSFVSDTRIEHAVARAEGIDFVKLQEHMFAFYRQHGIEEVEVHGLSENGWNGAHTWIRRGFYPDPDKMNRNFRNLEMIEERLTKIISRIERGRLPYHKEFLGEAREIRSEMTDLLNGRNQIEEKERLERLYQIWRRLTYLGEVKDSRGKTVRGVRESIGWMILGSESGSEQIWYYGLRSLDQYFK